MTVHQDQSTSTSLKGLLLLVAVVFAIAATLLVILSTSAATVTGQTPFVPISLIDGVNTGILGPGEQRWFKFFPGEPGEASHVEKSFTFIFTPGEDGNQNRHVEMQIFEENQLPFFYPRDVSKMTNLGAGQVVSRDNNSQTGERFWTGWLFSEQSYYVQLSNNGDTALDYWLLTDNVISYPLDEPETGTATSMAESEPIVAGTAPRAAIPLKSGQNKGSLNPGAEIWYSFSLSDADDEFFEEMALTMVVTPDDGHRIRHVTFDIFTARGVQNWSPGDNSQINNIGAGSVVYRDNNPLTGERIWSGWVVDNDLYYVQIRNGADIRMDYWLFTGDVYNPNLGGETNS
jgi:hypothetical protein